MDKWLLAIIAGLFALLALGASIVVPYLVLNQATTQIAHLEIPLLALSGFLGVFACVGLLVLAFSAMGLTDAKQSLGMPDGSVRALIAIFLIVTLGMTALFLLSPQQHGQPTKPEGSPSTQPPEPAAVPSTQPTNGNAPAAGYRMGSADFLLAALVTPTTQSGGGNPPDKHGTVPAPPPPGKDNPKTEIPPAKPETPGVVNQDNGDVAKQFLTMLGGLVTTIVGFYFGSQTASSASAKATEATVAAMRGGGGGH
jgi:hypothetical protein